APLEEGFEHFPLGARLPALGFAECVDEDVKWPFGGDARVELAHRARGAVARVGEQRQAARGTFVVDLLKRFGRQVHLAADFEMTWSSGFEGERDRTHGLQVGGDVLALGTVAARRADAEASLLVP